MLPPLRSYQATAVAAVRDHWQQGVRRVCVVAPPGAGKTRIGVEFPQTARTVWLAHRDELIAQAAEALRAAGLDVACISPLYPPDPWARVQVASIDTLVSRGQLPPADLVIVDECHHYVAETYGPILDAYPDALHVGLTATPQRQDGKPLGDRFDALVVAASYSTLLAEGSLVPCRVFRPDEYLGSDLARDPLDAWKRITSRLPEPPQTFAFAPDRKRCHEFAEQFRAAGVPSVAIDGNTPHGERAHALGLFRDGTVKVLWNVYVFTEGTNVPEASCCLLARGVGHTGGYLQITGRVLRPAPGKKFATLIDLAGVSHLHQMPTQDREYALDGRAIRAVGESLKNCPQCGATLPSATPVCDVCGYVFQQKPRARPKIWDLELREAVEEAGGDASRVSPEHKAREWARLRALCQAKGWGISWAVKQFRGQGLGDPDMSLVTEKEMVRELAALVRLQRERGWKAGFVKVRFKETFGRWPRADMLAAAEVFHG